MLAELPSSRLPAASLLDQHTYSQAVHLDKRNEHVMLDAHILYRRLKQFQLEPPQNRADDQQYLGPCQTVSSASHITQQTL